MVNFPFWILWYASQYLSNSFSLFADFLFSVFLCLLLFILYISTVRFLWGEHKRITNDHNYFYYFTPRLPLRFLKRLENTNYRLKVSFLNNTVLCIIDCTIFGIAIWKKKMEGNDNINCILFFVLMSAYYWKMNTVFFVLFNCSCDIFSSHSAAKEIKSINQYYK